MHAAGRRAGLGADVDVSRHICVHGDAHVPLVCSCLLLDGLEAYSAEFHPVMCPYILVEI